MRDVTTRRPGPVLSSRRERRAGAIPVLLTMAALLATCTGPSASSQGDASPAQGSTPAASGEPRSAPPPAAGSTADPGSTQAPGSTASPNPNPDAWTQLDLPDLARAATLEPTKAGPGVVALDTAFRLTSLDGRPPADLAAKLVAEPPISFVVASISGATALVRPKTALRPGTTYRISLVRADGSTEAAWAAQAASPLHILETIPGDNASGVPRDTGIELTFDQYGVTTADLARYFSIKPAVQGRFEAAGRTIAFVPDKPLAKGRLYTVTIRHGLPLAGTGQVLEQDRDLRFETAAKVRSRVTLAFMDALVEAGTRDQPAIGVYFELPEGRSAPRSLPVTVHRLGSLVAATRAYQAILDAPDWTRVSATKAVDTAGLVRVFKGTLATRKLEGGYRWLEVPRRLAAGWYVVTATWAGIPRQTLLQVTDIATFALVTTDRTAVWVNSLGTKDAAAGATVTVGGRRLGTTDARGLLVTTTPSMRAAGDDGQATALLVVRYRTQAAFERVTVRGTCGTCESEAVDDAWWHLFATDRNQYRSTDTVNAWGVVRNRDTGSVPESVTLALSASDSQDEAAAPIVTATATPDGTGVFAARLQLRGLPVGEYRIGLSAGDRDLGEAWFTVATITKPVWQLAVDTDRHAVLTGEAVTVTATATFFEGTPVAGTDLSFMTEDELGVAMRTDALGKGTGRLVLRSGPVDPDAGDGDEQWQVTDITGGPTLPEEAGIEASSSVAVFRSTAVLDTGATIKGSRLAISGKVSDVVFERFEQTTASPWDIDPRGDPRAGATVRLKIVESTPVRVKAGTSYDFITKRVTQNYEYDERTRTIDTRTVTTGTDGTFRLTMSVYGGKRSYTVTATYADEAGRRITSSAGAESAVQAGDLGSAYLVNANGTSGDDEDWRAEYSIGEAVRVRFHGTVDDPRVERYFYAVTQNGLLYAIVGSSPTFRTTFTRASVPSISISGVRFNGYGYEAAVGSFEAGLRLDDRRIEVRLAPDRARYAPGDAATIAIRTLGPDGRPVAASVFVQAVDEKLYAIGVVEDLDPLWDLYASGSDGIIDAVWSHHTPADGVDEGGWGDATGGGEDDRADFRDWLAGTIVTTGSDGRGILPLTLPDDLTSWHLTAYAVDRSYEAGAGTTALVVGLPFFAVATVAAEYLAADHPVIRVRGFGAGLAPGERVTFTVSSDTLPMSPVTVSAPAFEAAEVPLPALSVGMHRVRVAAVAGSASGRRSDAFVRTFEVVATRTTQTRTTWAALDGPVAVHAGAAFTRLALVEAGRGRVLPILSDLAWSEGGRADQVLAAALARRVLVEEFGLEAVSPTDENGLDPFDRMQEGLALVASGSPDLEVTVLAAMAGDPRLDRNALAEGLHETLDNGDLHARRDRRLLALAGLAALGEAVLGDVRAADARGDLTVREEITLAMAALFAGDEALAAKLERHVLERHGVQRGPWVKVATGAGDDPAVWTARLAIVAASLGDPVAADMDAFLEANPPKTTLVGLERALAARGWARRVVGSTAVAALTVDGTRREVTIRGGEPVIVLLTPAQAAGARVEPVSGWVLVVESLAGPLDPSTLTAPDGVSMTRSLSPSGTIGSADTVIVTLKVRLGGDAARDAWRVVELVPSGLAPLSSNSYYDGDDEDGSSVTGGSQGPDWVDGQRVEFTLGGNPKQATWTLRYVARVVTPGSYLWESAVLQSEIAPDEGLAIPSRTIVIAGIGR